MSGYDLANYVDVAERVQQFYAKHPEGRIWSEVIELTPERVVVRSFVAQTPDDPRPCSGMSMMNIPGTTNFTRGSEVENTETSAVGRAIAMAGFAVKGGIASRQEVMNKQHTAAPHNAPAVTAPVTAGEAYASGKVNRGKPPVDMNLRETPEGWAFGFVVEEQIEGKQYPRKVQVLVEGPLAKVMADVWDNPAEADVWGALVMVPWQKDGKDMPPFRRILATRVMTAEWTLPAPAAPAGVSVAPAGAQGKVENLDELPF